jgi:hypothetical protein
MPHGQQCVDGGTAHEQRHWVNAAARTQKNGYHQSSGACAAHGRAIPQGCRFHVAAFSQYNAAVTVDGVIIGQAVHMESSDKI